MLKVNAYENNSPSGEYKDKWRASEVTAEVLKNTRFAMGSFECLHIAS